MKPSFLVGFHPDRYPPSYYLVYRGGGDERASAHVRQLLEARLGELAAESEALRDVLASDDPERAERLLCDGSRVEVNEVLLRPEAGRAAIAEFIERRFARET